MDRALRTGIGVASAAALIATVPHAEEALLRLRPDSEKTYRYVMVQKQDALVSMGPMGDQRSVSTTRMDLSQTVRDINEEGDVAFEVVYDRIRMDAEAGGRSLTFDSAEEDPESSPDPMAMLIGKPLRLIVTQRGRIVRVEGLDAIFEAAIGAVDADPTVKPVLEMVRSSLSDEAMADMLQQSMAVLPEEPVTEGTSWDWSSEIANPAMGTMKITQNFEVEGFEAKLGRPCVRTAVRYVVEHDGEFPLVEQLRRMAAAQGQELDMLVDLGRAEGKGTLWLDRATGMTVALHGTIEMAIRMSMAVPGAQEAPDAPHEGRMDMSMALKTTQFLELQAD